MRQEERLVALCPHHCETSDWTVVLGTSPLLCHLSSSVVVRSTDSFVEINTINTFNGEAFKILFSMLLLMLDSRS